MSSSAKSVITPSLVDLPTHLLYYCSCPTSSASDMEVRREFHCASLELL